MLALRDEHYTTYSSAMSILALESYTSQVAAQQDTPETLQIIEISKSKGSTLTLSQR